jgi:hypothetical protein
MVSFPDDFSFVHNHAADERIGTYLPFAPFGKLDGPTHE